MRQRWTRTASFTGLLVLCAAAPAQAIHVTVASGQSTSNAVTLAEQLAALFPATGYSGQTTGGTCTGTLVSPTQVLTAAHCVDQGGPQGFNIPSGIADDPINTYAFGLELNTPSFRPNNVVAIDINPMWVSTVGDPGYDFAIITLAEPITHVAPALITSQNPVGQEAVLVGYGTQGTGTTTQDPSGANDKLAATNVIDVLEPARFSEGNTLQLDFDSPAGNTNVFGSSQPINGQEGATAGGDSGSPLMALFGETYFLSGILYGGYNDFGSDSLYGDVSIYAPVTTPENAAWLASQGLRIIEDTTPVLGDANRDWFVDQSDLDLVLANWGASPTAGTGADVSGDGFVGIEDLDILLAQWGAGTPFPGVALAAAAVPEPGSLALLSIGLLVMRCRRR